MSENIEIISFKENSGRIAVAAVILTMLVFGWFAIRWQVGNMLAGLTSPAQPDAEKMADTAISLAPSDPTAHWLSASLEKDIFSPEKSDAAAAKYESAVKLSPYDFRWWIELGRAYEQAEMTDKAEAAFRQAVRLAPSYTYPHWQLGNFYLREGRADEAFAEFRKTTENNIPYREQVFSLAWEYFDKDPAQVEALASDEPDVKASLALFYAARGAAEDSLRIWNTLTDEQKAQHPDTARTILQGLYDKRYAGQALEFARQSGIDSEAQFETVTNGGFEKGVSSGEQTFFGWKIERTDSKLDIANDQSVKRSGARSIRLNFKGYAKPELHNVWQIVAVQPGASYRVSFWARTENLRSAGPPVIEAVNWNDDKIIASSGPIPTGTNDWQQFTVEFTAPENCQGIALRTVRSFCGDACPITGTVWMDDFEMVRR